MEQEFKTSDNHVYMGNKDKILDWLSGSAGSDNEKINSNNKQNLIVKLQELIKNYLELDNVSFLFGTGSSIHLGSASIRNIPKFIDNQMRSKTELNANERKIYLESIKHLQSSQLKSYKDKKGKDWQDKEIYEDEKSWSYIMSDGIIRNYSPADEKELEINVPLETLLNYLIAKLYVSQAENAEDQMKSINNVINHLKKGLFAITDINERKTNDCSWRKSCRR